MASVAVTTNPSKDGESLRTVLYIEDNPVNQLLIEQVLCAMPGVRLVLAGTGAEGLEAARALKPNLILLDMRLPDMSGMDVMQALREQPELAQLRVVGLSASALPAEVEQAKAHGAVDYWTKPLDFNVFLKNMHAMLSS